LHNRQLVRPERYVSLRRGWIVHLAAREEDLIDGGGVVFPSQQPHPVVEVGGRVRRRVPLEGAVEKIGGRIRVCEGEAAYGSRGYLE